MSLDIGFASQAPSLPSGGGVGGLGETFAPDLSTGTGTFAVPLDLPHGPNDSRPRLALHYDSGSGNGVLGVGWSLPLPRLLRSTMVGRPRYDDSDTIVLEGAGPLVRADDGSLHPEVDAGDWRLVADGGGFVATDRAGTRHRLGADAASRIPGLGGETWAWLLTESEDNVGERTTYRWRAAGSQRYLDGISWGPFEVRFLWEARPDVIRWGRGGFLLDTVERCAGVELHLPAEPSTLVRRWDLTYTQAAGNGASLLAGVTLTGFGADGTSLTAPPLSLGYAADEPVTLRRLDPIDARSAPPGLTGSGRVELVDWTGTGTADVIEFGADGAARVWPNEAGRLGRPVSAGTVPALGGPLSRSGLVDVDGDGVADLVRADVPLARYQSRTADGFGRTRTLGAAPAIAPGDPRARLADFDGTGSAGLLWGVRDALVLAQRDEDGDWLPRLDVVPGTPDGPPTDLTDPRVHCADMTGDGTPDLVRVDGAGVSYWPYLGHGVFGDRVEVADAPRLPADCDPASILVVDLDGDGCADVVHLERGTLRAWVNQAGARFGAERRVEHLPTGSMANVRVADVLATGRPALVWSTPLASGRGRWFALDLGVTAPLLTRIDNGVGRSTAITWTTSARESERDRAAGSPWTTRLPVVLPVVAEIAVDDVTTGSVALTRYRYHDGRYDGVLREVCGFGRVETEEVGDESIPTLHTTRWFHTGRAADGSEPTSAAARRRSRALRGRLLRQERVGPGGHLFDRFGQEWRVEPGSVGATVTPRLVATTTSVHEGAADPVSSIVTEQHEWDADGNVTRAVERSLEGSTVDHTLETTTTYAVDPAGRYRSRVARVLQVDGTGVVLSDLRTTYDGLPEGQVGGQGLVTGRSALCLTDDRVATVYGADPPDLASLGYTRRPGTDGWWVELGAYERAVDASGLHGRTVGPRGGVSTLDFDPAGCYPVRVTDAVGNTLTAQFDLRSYQPTAVVHPSGATTTAAYDVLARLTATVEPGDTAAEPTRDLAYETGASPLCVTETRATSPGLGRRVQRQFIDGDGRVVQQRIRDESGEVVTVTTDYGRRGVVARTYLPFRAASPSFETPSPGAAHATVTYDALGRALATTRPDGAVAAVRYLPGAVEERDFEQTRTDPGAPHADALTRRLVDASGRIRQVEQVLDGATVVTSDTHDVKGALVEHVDAVGATTRFVHDLLGRTLRIERPESTQVVVVDAAGNVVETRTGADRVLRRYDLAARPVEVRHGDPASVPVARFVYHDDGPAPADAGTHTSGGRLVRVEDEGGVCTLDYDERGRLARKAMTPVGGSTLVLELEHRSDDLVDRITYPGGRLLRYRYTAVGSLRAIDGIIERIDYNDVGQRTRVAYSNGTAEVTDHDPVTGWLTGSVLTGPGGALREVHHGHDLVGNLISVTSPDLALAWQYAYDDGYRLVSATSAAAAVGTLAYGYDAAANLISSSGLGALTYGGGGAAASALTGAGGDSFGYDGRGRLTSAPWGTHGVDAEGRVRRIDLVGGGRDELTYGHGGALVARVTTSATGESRTVLSPDPLIRVEDGEVVLQVSDGDRVVARETTVGRVWLHHDHRGSLVLVTDAAGAETLRITYDPYGQVLSRTGPGAAPQGFGTGQDVGHGLVLLGERWYCPRIGRFLAPDPVVGDPDDPVAWNAYAYCRGNPTSYVDPSGRSFWKIFAAVVATIAIIAVAVIVTVCTFGIGTPGAVALTVGGLSITWGAVFAATVVGIVAGGVIGGIAAARAGGDAGDVFLGVVVGGAVGGWAAFGGAFAGIAVGGALGLTSGTVLAGAVVGGVSGAINGAAMGFASGFAGGRNKGIGDIMTKVLVGAIVGLALGAALGALSGAVTPKDSLGDALAKGSRPDPGSVGAGAQGAPAGGASGASGAGGSSISSVGDAAASVGGKLAGHYAGIAAPYAAAWAAPAAGNAWVQAIVVDAGSAAASALFDDLQDYVRTHNVDLGPFDFIKGDF